MKSIHERELVGYVERKGNRIPLYDTDDLTAYMFLKLDGLISIYVSKNDYNKTVNK
jgi:hypothetical protein